MADYIPLATAADLEDALEASRTHRVAIFKHSTTCPVSSLAKNRVDRALRQTTFGMPAYYLDLLRYREVSNLVAERLGVRHESPHLIVVENGRAVYSSSHLAIDPAAVPAAAA